MVFLDGQVETILRSLGVDVVAETPTNILCRCPFHHNFDSPAFSISKDGGLYMCFNPSCGERGNMIRLVEKMKNMNFFQASEYLESKRGEVDTLALLSKIREEEKFEFKEYDRTLLANARAAFPTSPAHRYMNGRGFEDDTLRYFDIGYLSYDQLVIVPMHDPEGMPIGYIGRSVSGKSFANSYKLPKMMVPWNYHRAKRESDTVVVVESSFDAMRVHQAGYPAVVATLGAFLSEKHAYYLDRSFSNIIVMTDNDEAGRKLGQSIVDRFPYKKVMWAAGKDEIYPDGVKDATDMTDDQIRFLLMNAMSTFEYVQAHVV